tara:strand:+ start:5544 stop:6002 length:459 start_codon:yes stop_codon:yes gene_type:complete
MQSEVKHFMKDIKQNNRISYKYFHTITTRWMDNDIYGHVNNVTYYSYFDTTVNQYLIDCAGINIQKDTVVGYVVNSQCEYFSGIAYPDQIEVGLRVNETGNSSVTYGLAAFKKGETTPCAIGSFVHVFVNRMENKPVSIPLKIRESLELLAL